VSVVDRVALVIFFGSGIFLMWVMAEEIAMVIWGLQ